MAGTITHEWNGTTLIITSDAGTTAMDLKGATGAVGPRGPQGPAGVVLNSNGSVDLTGYATENYVNQKVADVEAGVIDLSAYYTRQQVDQKIETINISNYYNKAQSDLRYLQPDALNGYATQAYVTNKITEASLGGGGGSIDITGLATKDDLTGYRMVNDNTFTNGIVATDGATTINLTPTGISCGTGALDIGVNGEAHFCDIYSNGDKVATEEFVRQFFEGIVNGDEVGY